MASAACPPRALNGASWAPLAPAPRTAALQLRTAPHSAQRTAHFACALLVLRTARRAVCKAGNAAVRRMQALPGDPARQMPDIPNCLADGTPGSKAGNAAFRKTQQSFGKPVRQKQVPELQDCLADGTPVSKAGNAAFRKTQQSFGKPVRQKQVPELQDCLADGTPVSKAGNAAFRKTQQSFGKPVRQKQVPELQGCLADGTPVASAGNRSLKGHGAPSSSVTAPCAGEAIARQCESSLPDGTARNAAGNLVNYPEKMPPDLVPAPWLQSRQLERKRTENEVEILFSPKSGKNGAAGTPTNGDSSSRADEPLRRSARFAELKSQLSRGSGIKTPNGDSAAQDSRSQDGKKRSPSLAEVKARLQSLQLQSLQLERERIEKSRDSGAPNGSSLLADADEPLRTSARFAELKSQLRSPKGKKNGTDYPQPKEQKESTHDEWEETLLVVAFVVTLLFTSGLTNQAMEPVEYREPEVVIQSGARSGGLANLFG
ncbi:unnamed protein product [Effrenium voratum]|uniref:Uncharacterized protein n=1 Tax=Effrenium voratum TaxID=2562239 RepID=A0AA36HJS7_9DINO|nr:unnamed protein product [Effrenium voratum]CAJ1461646.1 unnamed protein product [Effrenium voratum]